MLMMAVLIWRLPDVTLRDLVPKAEEASPAWAALGLGLLLLAYGLSALRWQSVISILTVAPPFRHLLAHVLAGQFVSNVLPTAFGGDVIRVSRLNREIDDLPVAVASVSVERLSGWFVLPVLSLCALAVQPNLLHTGAAGRLALAVGCSTLLALIIVFLVATRAPKDRTAPANALREALSGVGLGLRALRARPQVLPRLLLTGLSFQATQCLGVWALGRAIGLSSLELGAVLAFFPAAAIAQNLPIGLGGVGVREAAFVVLFGGVGVSRAPAISFGLSVYLATVAVSALGAPSFLLGGGRRDEAGIGKS
ncbi:MAG TPA: hypothetical protein DEG43_09175 [Acidimicrobiaceae bacterium]|nr:hypothetical protein [Acidimicrobiaceae bacterium]